MAPNELEEWLKTEVSKSVDQDSGDGGAIGHKSGKKIIDIITKKRMNYQVHVIPIVTEESIHPSTIEVIFHPVTVD